MLKKPVCEMLHSDKKTQQKHKVCLTNFRILLILNHVCEGERERERETERDRERQRETETERDRDRDRERDRERQRETEMNKKVCSVVNMTKMKSL